MMRKSSKEQLIDQLLKFGADTYEYKNREYVSYRPALEDEEDPGYCINIDALTCRTRDPLPPKDVKVEASGMPDRYVVKAKYRETRMEVLVNAELVEIREVSGFLDEFIKLVVFIREYLETNHQKIYLRLLEELYADPDDDDSDEPHLDDPDDEATTLADPGDPDD